MSALDLFSELPTSGTMISVSVMQRGASERGEVQRKERVCMCLVPGSQEARKPGSQTDVHF